MYYGEKAQTTLLFQMHHSSVALALPSENKEALKTGACGPTISVRKSSNFQNKRKWP